MSGFILHEVFYMRSPLRNVKWHIEEQINKNSLSKNGCSASLKKYSFTVS